MQTTAHRVAMLLQVVRVEIRKSPEAIWRHGRCGLSHDGAQRGNEGAEASFLSGIKGVKRMLESTK